LVRALRTVEGNLAPLGARKRGRKEGGISGPKQQEGAIAYLYGIQRRLGIR